jgi:hypothetical protein
MTAIAARSRATKPREFDFQALVSLSSRQGDVPSLHFPGLPGQPGQPEPHAHASSGFTMPVSTFMPVVVLLFFALMVAALAMDADTRMGQFVFPLWFLLLGLAWHLKRKAAMQQAPIQEWKTVRDVGKIALTESVPLSR